MLSIEEHVFLLPKAFLQLVRAVQVAHVGA